MLFMPSHELDTKFSFFYNRLPKAGSGRNLGSRLTSECAKEVFAIEYGMNHCLRAERDRLNGGSIGPLRAIMDGITDYIRLNPHVGLRVEEVKEIREHLGVSEDDSQLSEAWTTSRVEARSTNGRFPWVTHFFRRAKNI